jgi:hypothetical protein
MCVTMLSGCASKPALHQIGFLSEHAKVEEIGESRMRHMAPNSGQYRQFFAHPVIVELHGNALSTEDGVGQSTPDHEFLNAR